MGLAGQIHGRPNSTAAPAPADTITLTPVFTALTTKDGLRGWHAQSVAGDPSPGGTMTLTFQRHEPFQWQVSSAGPTGPVRWDCLAGPGTGPGTAITFTLSDTPDGRTQGD
jgi:uncharacterized protein YndB with AHSA1/START domain